MICVYVCVCVRVVALTTLRLDVFVELTVLRADYWTQNI